jgi:chromosome segregation ATPase
MPTKKNIDNNNTERAYAYYSKTLKCVFDSLDALKTAEAKHFDELKAKEDKAAAKKHDASKVEAAFKALNQSRKIYKESLSKLTAAYSEDLKALRDDFDNEKQQIHAALADAETAYSTALKEFTEKYPEGYHITMRDGDFETTISNQTRTSNYENHNTRMNEILDLLFNFDF